MPTVDTDNLTADGSKKRKVYSMKDLPVPSDQRWSRNVIGTLTLWCGTQPNVWNIPDQDFVDALQVIFDAIYPEVDHQVSLHGAVHAVVNYLLNYSYEDSFTNVFKGPTAYIGVAE